MNSNSQNEQYTKYDGQKIRHVEIYIPTLKQYLHINQVFKYYKCNARTYIKQTLDFTIFKSRPYLGNSQETKQNNGEAKLKTKQVLCQDQRVVQTSRSHFLITGASGTSLNRVPTIFELLILKSCTGILISFGSTHSSPC